MAFITFLIGVVVGAVGIFVFFRKDPTDANKISSRIP